MMKLLWLSSIFTVILFTQWSQQLTAEDSSNLQGQFDADWLIFKSNYSKSYPDPDSEELAKQTFLKNWGRIYDHNLLYFQGNVSDYWGSNKFLDQKFGSSQPGLLGTSPREQDLAAIHQNLRLFSEPVVSLPTSVDYTTKGAVTPVKDQGGCGSCWAFSTTGTLEGIYALQTGTLLNMSEKQLVDCTGDYGNGGCNGGWMPNALTYVKENQGIVRGSDYSYKAQQNTCNKAVAQNLAKLIAVLQGKGYVLIPKGDANAMQKAVANIGPVSIAIHVVDSFYYYKSGVYVEKNCNPETPNHALLIVGYGTETSGSSTLPYWKVKNSWGTTWGDAGYIKILRGSNTCGIENFGMYADMAPIASPTISTTTSTSTTTSAPTPPIPFDLHPTSDSALTDSSEVVVFSMSSASSQFAAKLNRFLTAQNIALDFEKRYGKRWRVIIGTVYSFSGGYEAPNYIVLKQKGISPPVYVTIAQLPDCGIDCNKDLGNSSDALNLGDFTLLASDGKASSQLLQVMIDHTALALLYLNDDTSQIVKYVSNNLQNDVGGFMDVIAGSDYDAYFKYRVPKYLRLKKDNMLIDIYAPDCIKPMAPLRSESILPPSFSKSWWTNGDNPEYFGMCGKYAPLYKGRYAVCNPDDDLYHCCSPDGSCGDGPDYCSCDGCSDYAANKNLIAQDAVTPSRPLQWFTLADNFIPGPKCGFNAPRINRTLVAICNPDDPFAYCCSSAGYCGNTPAHCECQGCVNFKKNPTFSYT